MSDETAPEADRIAAAPHPRETSRLLGQEAAQATFLDAVAQGKLHHGWLLSGPRGVGKATLAWRIARMLLTCPVSDLTAASAARGGLDPDLDAPAQAQITALSHPGLFLLRRIYDPEKKRIPAQIGVDEVRKVKSFFALAAGPDAYRVVLVDAVDDLTVSAANALLKLLEEPPQNTILLLISHQPAGLLPTIRSRCRELRLAPLSPEDVAEALALTGLTGDADPQTLSALAGGSVGEAVAMIEGDGAALYAELIALVGRFPDLDRQAALKLAEKFAPRDAGAKLDLMIRLVDILLLRLSRAGLDALPEEAVPGERDALIRLCPDAGAARAWAMLATAVGERLRHGRAVNLDPAALVLDMILTLNSEAAKRAA